MGNIECTMQASFRWVEKAHYSRHKMNVLNALHCAQWCEIAFLVKLFINVAIMMGRDSLLFLFCPISESIYLRGIVLGKERKQNITSLPNHTVDAR